MRGVTNYNNKWMVGLLAFVLGLTAACANEELVEPATYVPKEIRRLLTNDSTKTWQQTSGYYLEEECRTGYFVKFSENSSKDLKRPFLAYFQRDLENCDPSPDTVLFNDGSYQLVVQEAAFIEKNVMAITSPAFKTTDTLRFTSPLADTTIFVGPEQDTVYYIHPLPDTTFRLIRLLTNELLLFDVLGPDKQLLYQESYKAVKPVAEEEGE